jgi:hypothetical protein
VHRLEFKIENHDDLLSFAQIDIIDTDVSERVEQEKVKLPFSDPRKKNFQISPSLLNFIYFQQEPHEVHINTQPTYYEVLIVSSTKLRGFVKVYHKAPENFHHLTKLFPQFFPNGNGGRKSYN